MSKIKSLKSGWIQIGDGHSINLKPLKSVTQGNFGMDESPGDAYFIKVTEFEKDEYGEEKNYIIATYKEGEKDMWKEDYKNILEALNSI